MVDAAARTRALRLRAQGLTGRPAGDPQIVCERLVGIQAQELAFARLAFRPRCGRTVVVSDVDAALRDGRLIWTWAMRGTLHLVSARDAGWLVGLLGPILAGKGRPRRLALGLDDARCAHALTVIDDVLRAEGPQTRAALAARLGLDARGQAPAHLLAYAGLRGAVCRVRSAAGREPTFALREDPPLQVDEDEALARLARRYLAGHGPARAEDLAAWSGIGMRRAARGWKLIAGEVREGPLGTSVLHGTSTRARHTAAAPHVRLLGHFDPYLLGYASRDLVLDRRFAKRVQAGGGLIAPTLLVGGRVAGTWRRHEQDWLAPFEPLADELLKAAEHERADVARFLAASV